MNTGFRHDVLLYERDEGFVDGALPFITDGLRADEPVLVAVCPTKIDLLRNRLGPDAERVQFADMVDLGRNPACMLAALDDFTGPHLDAGRRVRGIGEPIWAGRREAEIVEAQLHESLLDTAFGDGAAWWLMCLYDTAALDPAIIETARAGHDPQRATDGVDYFETPLPEPIPPTPVLRFTHQRLAVIREFVAAHATASGIGADRTADLVVAVNEAATNSLRHGGGNGSLRIWSDDHALVCEVTDQGCVKDCLAGRRRPSVYEVGGRGLWLVNNLCDLVQLRSSANGTVLRVHMNLR